MFLEDSNWYVRIYYT